MALWKRAACTALVLIFVPALTLLAIDKHFHDAPDSAKADKNPLDGQDSAIPAGKALYTRNCVACHGKTLQGTGNVPSLVDGKLKGVTGGELFWFISKGDKDNGMPSWAFLPQQQRWQVVSYVEAMVSDHPTAGAASTPAEPANASDKISAPSPTAPFTDFRYQKPGTIRKITVNDLPKPFATSSAENGAQLVSRPENVWPQAPAGYNVGLYASGLENPRLLRTAPNGDVFLAESEPGRIRVFR